MHHLDRLLYFLVNQIYTLFTISYSFFHFSLIFSDMFLSVPFLPLPSSKHDLNRLLYSCRVVYKIYTPSPSAIQFYSYILFSLIFSQFLLFATLPFFDIQPSTPPVHYLHVYFFHQVSHIFSLYSLCFFLSWICLFHSLPFPAEFVFPHEHGVGGKVWVPVSQWTRPDMLQFILLHL